MDKINENITIPVMELTEIVAKCGEIVAFCTKLIREYSTKPKNVITSETKDNPSADHKKEDSSKSEKFKAPSEEEASSGLLLHKQPNNKPFEIVIE